MGKWVKKLRKLFEDMMKNLFFTTSMPSVSEKKRDLYHQQPGSEEQQKPKISETDYSLRFSPEEAAEIKRANERIVTEQIERLEAQRIETFRKIKAILDNKELTNDQKEQHIEPLRQSIYQVNDQIRELAQDPPGYSRGVSPEEIEKLKQANELTRQQVEPLLQREPKHSPDERKPTALDERNRQRRMDAEASQRGEKKSEPLSRKFIESGGYRYDLYLQTRTLSTEPAQECQSQEPQLTPEKQAQRNFEKDYVAMIKGQQREPNGKIL